MTTTKSTKDTKKRRREAQSGWLPRSSVEDTIEEAFLLLDNEDGTTSWHHFDFHEDPFDAALQSIAKAKEKAGVDEVSAVCAYAQISMTCQAGTSTADSGMPRNSGRTRIIAPHRLRTLPRT